MAERPPRTDLRGGKASEDSFTRLTANLVAEYAVDFQSDWFTDAVLGSTVSYSEDFGRSFCPSLKTDRNRLEKEGRSVLREKLLDKSFRGKLFAYRLTPDHEGLRDWMLAKPRYRFQGLGLIPWDVVRQGQVRFGLRWDQSRSWLCFAPDDGLLVEGGVLKTSYRRWVGVDGGTITDSWPRGIHSVPGQH